MFDFIQRVIDVCQGPRRPQGMSRRGFLRACGQTAMISIGAASSPCLLRLFPHQQAFLLGFTRPLQKPETWYMSQVGDPLNWDYSPTANEAEQLEAGRLAFMNRMAADLSPEAVEKRKLESPYSVGTSAQWDEDAHKVAAHYFDMHYGPSLNELPAFPRVDLSKYVPRMQRVDKPGPDATG